MDSFPAGVSTIPADTAGAEYSADVSTVAPATSRDAGALRLVLNSKWAAVNVRLLWSTDQ
jgi:hypothetical protein